MWPFKSRTLLEHEAIGRATTAAFVEGIERVQAGRPLSPLSPGAAALRDRQIERHLMLYGDDES